MNQLIRVLLLLTIGCNPAWAYWQQKVNFQIEVALDDLDHVLRGKEKISYINHSPDTLLQMYMHLWPNAYNGEKSALATQLLDHGESYLHYSMEGDLGFIDSLDFQVNHKSITWRSHPEHDDVALLLLEDPLLPGDTLHISTPFKVKIPHSDISRLGHDGQSYQMSQWFPKPAVYDMDGWHPYPYLDQGEFYSEFGDFQVQITLPDNYVVASTGNLSEASRSLEYEFLEKRREKTQVILKKDSSHVLSNNFPASTKKLKTLHFEQKNVHDFAWFADKRWLVGHEILTLPDSKRRVDLWSYFLPSHAKLWHKSTDFIRKSLVFYSNEVGEFPYDHCTAVDGDLSVGSGMEYPNVTIIGQADDKLSLEEVIMHEVGHNWFYGMLGSDERAHPWMDEGLNSYFERKYMKNYYPNAVLLGIRGIDLSLVLQGDEPALDSYYWYAYAFQASRGQDQSGGLKANEFTPENYAAVVYAKSAVLFNYLAAYLGEEVFDQAIKNYFKDWKFKHPKPEDLRRSFEKESEEDLSWFFQGLLGSNIRLDYGIKSVKTKEDNLFVKLVVKNYSSVKAPVKIDLIRNDSVVYSYWFTGFEGQKNLFLPKDDFGNLDQIDAISIDQENVMPDLNRENNHYELGVFFPKIEPIESSFLFDVPKQDKTQMCYAPFLAYNATDQLQLGVLLHNSMLIEKKMRYVMMPTYGFGSKRLGGFYKGIYSFYPRANLWEKINFAIAYNRNGLSGTPRDGYFDKLEPAVTFFMNRNKPTTHQFKLRYSRTSMFVPTFNTLTNQYCTGSYSMKNDRILHPFKGSAHAQLINGKQLKLWGEFTQKVTLYKGGSSIDFRVFAGVFLGSKADDLTHRFRLTAGNGADAVIGSGDDLINRGITDYLYDEVYLARYSPSNNALSQQVSIQDGGFRTGLFLGANNDWLSSLNITIPTPTKYLSVFIDGGIYPGSQETSLACSGGIQLNFWKDVFEVYFPLLFSSNISDNYDAVGLNEYAQRIKFLFNIGQYKHLID